MITNAAERLRPWAAMLLIVFLSACSDGAAPKLQRLEQDAVILAFGDSLTYGTGADHHTESYPAVLGTLSDRKIINAGVPGEESREGLIRIRILLEQHQPDLVLLCHGGNDLIRKLGGEQLQQNLVQMIEAIRESGAQVVMLAVPKPGVFLKAAPVYSEVAEQLQVPLENNIIADIESENTLKSDAIHPNAKGYRLLAERVHELLSQGGAF